MYKGNHSKDKSHYAHCLTLLTAFKRRHIKRLIALFALLCINIYFHVLTFGVKYGGPSLKEARIFELPLSDRPFAMGVVSATCSLALLFIAFFAEVKRPKLLILFFLIAIAATVSDLIHWAIGAVIIVLYLTQLRENMQYKWVKQQSGFPHFNKRLDEQLKTSEYAMQQLNAIDQEIPEDWDIIRDYEDDDTWDGDILNLDAISKYINIDDIEENDEEGKTGEENNTE